MAESVGDVTTVQQNLLRNLDGAELALHGQARMSRDLQQALMQVRMVPFESLADRLYRVQAMERAVQDGRITQERLEQSLARVARLKARYLHPYKPVTISDARLVVGCRSHKVLLDSWRKAHARLPSSKMSESLQSSAALDSPVAHA